MPKINPFVTGGLRALISIALAVSGWAGDVSGVFAVIGASFGPVCGAMMADYLLAGRKWSGPRGRLQPGRLDLVDRRLRRRRVQSGDRAHAEVGPG